jgi:hypothetical protein
MGKSAVFHQNKVSAIFNTSLEGIASALLFLLHRVSVYASNNLIEDPAMLAIIFC